MAEFMPSLVVCSWMPAVGHAHGRVAMGMAMSMDVGVGIGMVMGMRFIHNPEARPCPYAHRLLRQSQSSHCRQGVDWCAACRRCPSVRGSAWPPIEHGTPRRRADAHFLVSFDLRWGSHLIRRPDILWRRRCDVGPRFIPQRAGLSRRGERSHTMFKGPLILMTPLHADLIDHC